MDTTQIIYWITEREEIHYRRACGTDSVQPRSQPGGGDVGTSVNRDTAPARVTGSTFRAYSKNSSRVTGER